LQRLRQLVIQQKYDFYTSAVEQWLHVKYKFINCFTPTFIRHEGRTRNIVTTTLRPTQNRSSLQCDAAAL